MNFDFLSRDLWVYKENMHNCMFTHNAFVDFYNVKSLKLLEAQSAISN